MTASATRRALRLVAIAAAALAPLGSAQAADGVGGRNATALTFSPAPDLSVSHETIHITADVILAQYVLRNSGAGEATTDISMTLNGADVSNPERHPGANCRNEIDLKATVFGVAPALSIKTIATVGGIAEGEAAKDVTAQLAALGLDVNAPDSCDLGKLGIETVKALEQAGFLTDVEITDGRLTYWEPSWSETTTIGWRQTIPAGGNVVIATTQENYPWQSDMSADKACFYGLPADTTPPAGGLVKGMSYALLPAGGIQGPVGRFILTIQAAPGVNWSCYAAGDTAPKATLLQADPANPTLLVLDKTDFIPKGSVEIFFEQPPGTP